MNKRKIILISITLLLTGQLAAQQDTVAQYDEEKCYHSLYVYGSIGAGDIKAGGFYGGMAAGIHIRRFLCVTIGSSLIPCTADLVAYSTGAALYKNGLMWNFYIRCGLNVLGIRKK